MLATIYDSKRLYDVPTGESDYITKDESGALIVDSRYKAYLYIERLDAIATITYDELNTASGVNIDITEVTELETPTPNIKDIIARDPDAEIIDTDDYSMLTNLIMSFSAQEYCRDGIPKRDDIDFISIPSYLSWH